MPEFDTTKQTTTTTVSQNSFAYISPGDKAIWQDLFATEARRVKEDAPGWT